MAPGFQLSNEIIKLAPRAAEVGQFQIVLQLQPPSVRWNWRRGGGPVSALAAVSRQLDSRGAAFQDATCADRRMCPMCNAAARQSRDDR
ncbi:hypothetical protein EMIHUDRAFT_204180 [Emiliania huxleyi CCMP1516]|uniref:Uncharacterized protein n=2 Tax=Emiliania huxleyi TaxID=2903 RepID=A0A0D3JXW5_EMIH1|nr:hypothetical protein EMIHUDRAFT_204180 [Emiliania huxleyi CCMP1516]EOD28350.1 hypothetical protein EMIHUDRAFT_204180 [Emiliania huxleyi CCMP1516]|eukprot:XP_005780779.1 hypothetical protein EMIHUDRAFT_204180 [Emiliania huxleyi CCMP1516]